MLIREAIKADAPGILQLIKELAEYEQAAHEVKSTVTEIEESLFTDGAKAFCHVAIENDQIVGIAIWFLNYSTWLGKHGIYLEDLYVKPEFRGQKIGMAFMKTLAKICVENGYERFQWWVLDWNKPSIDFYQSIGAVAMDEWTVFRLSGEKLKAFANG